MNGSRDSEKSYLNHPLDPLRELREETTLEEAKGFILTGALLGLFQNALETHKESDESATENGAKSG